jgi:hypothetical protein
MIIRIYQQKNDGWMCPDCVYELQLRGCLGTKLFCSIEAIL